MSTYLLTWNPHKWPWSNIVSDTRQCLLEGYLDQRWSCGRNTHIRPDDRVFLLRQGKQQRGIIASGRATSRVFEAPHWREDDQVKSPIARYIDVRFDILLDADREPIFRREWLDAEPFSGIHWNTQISGIRIPEPIASALEREWASFLASRKIAQ